MFVARQKSKQCEIWNSNMNYRYRKVLTGVFYTRVFHRPSIVYGGRNSFLVNIFFNKFIDIWRKNSLDDIELPRFQVITLFYFYKEEDVLLSYQQLKSS